MLWLKLSRRSTMPRTDIPAWKLKVTERPVALPAARVCVGVVWGWRWTFFSIFLRGFRFNPFRTRISPYTRHIFDARWFCACHSSFLTTCSGDSKPYMILKALDESYKNHKGFGIIRASGDEQWPPTSIHVRTRYDRRVLSSGPERVRNSGRTKKEHGT